MSPNLQDFTVAGIELSDRRFARLIQTALRAPAAVPPGKRALVEGGHFTLGDVVAPVRSSRVIFEDRLQLGLHSLSRTREATPGRGRGHACTVPPPVDGEIARSHPFDPTDQNPHPQKRPGPSSPLAVWIMAEATGCSDPSSTAAPPPAAQITILRRITETELLCMQLACFSTLQLRCARHLYGCWDSNRRSRTSGAVAYDRPR